MIFMWRIQEKRVELSCRVFHSEYENLIGLYDILEDMNILFLDLIAHPLISTVLFI